MADRQRAIWKFQLRPWESLVDMPADAELVSVGVQREGSTEQAVVWALVDPTAPTVKRKVGAVPTGGTVIGEAAYVGTFQIEGGLVFHVFDGGERR
jgi:hypothetical protein